MDNSNQNIDEVKAEVKYFCSICGFEGNDLICPVCGEKMESLETELDKIKEREESDDLLDVESDEISLEQEVEKEHKEAEKEANEEDTGDL